MQCRVLIQQQWNRMQPFSELFGFIQYLVSDRLGLHEITQSQLGHIGDIETWDIGVIVMYIVIMMILGNFGKIEMTVNMW